MTTITIEHPAQLAHGFRSALVVDDEPAVAEIVADFLSDLDVVVTVLNDPREALDLIVERPEQFDILVTDVRMPWMDGQELFKRAQTVRGDLPVVFVTGYAADLVLPGPVVAKPFKQRDLLAALAKAAKRRTLQTI